MAESNLLDFERVSKRYRLGAGQGSLRAVLSGIAPMGRRAGNSSDSDRDYIWALHDVSFSAEKGDVVGIVGHNGAGKTTVLKLLSGVTTPTSGDIHLNGRVAALIELGAGFHPDLTGRENIYLNGVILGLSRREIDRKFSSIVDFAELERFIDTPVKRYSSGMYARLGFAVAAHTDPDLLVIDEVLGVGDQNFQRKCFDFIHSYVTGGRSALFVSHNLYVIEELCNKLVWLDHGRVRMAGTPRDVLPRYFDHLEEEALQRSTVVAQGDRIEIRCVTFSDAHGRERDTFAAGENVIVRIAYQASERVERPHFVLGVVGPEGGLPIFTASMLVDGDVPDEIVGDGVVACRFEAIPLMPRTYNIWGEIWTGDRSRTLFDWQRLGAFRVRDREVALLDARGTSIRHQRADGPVRVAYQWEY